MLTCRWPNNSMYFCFLKKISPHMDAILKSAATAHGKRPKAYPAAVKAWLIAGLVMIFFQVVIGGVTRLTGSGLSITKWEIVTGTLPPLNAAQWEEAFELYRATPQYQKINEGMSMGEFKFIYFWEYFHRLWARLMGLVFLLPLGYFWARGMVDRPLLKRLGVVFLLAALVASFGWIMVASGLVNRPWVNAYKLAMHLSLALALFAYLLWLAFRVLQPSPEFFHNKMLKKASKALLLLLAAQLFLGGVMSGMKAGLFYPTWPDMNGEAVPGVLLSASSWTVENFVNYDAGLFMAALVQLLHRTVAYALFLLGFWFIFRGLSARPSRPLQTGLYLLASLLITQVLLGIFTVINSKGIIPVGLGVLHQAGAILLLSAALFVHYQLRGGTRRWGVEKAVEKRA
jgi:heme a synthase